MEYILYSRGVVKWDGDFNLLKSVGNSVGLRRSGGERSGGERSGGELLMELKKPVVNKDGVCW